MKPSSPPSRLRGSFIRGVLAVGGGTALTQIAAVLSSPILTRLYRPDDLGVWGLFVSYIGFVSTMSSLRYEVSIVATREDKDARELTSSSLFLVMLTSFLGALAFELMRRRGFLGFEVFTGLTTALVFFRLALHGFRVSAPLPCPA